MQSPAQPYPLRGGPWGRQVGAYVQWSQLVSADLLIIKGAPYYSDRHVMAIKEMQWVPEHTRKAHKKFGLAKQGTGKTMPSDMSNYFRDRSRYELKIGRAHV